MSILSQAVESIKEALRLADDVRRAGDTLKGLSQEVRDHDRRITRLEAQWETAVMLSQKRLE
ncbi:MAG TPA: hypothetical protein VMF10_14145 [Candidatus Aquilonibacter sp.]|jgi:hypothetical protein|nr:hypothetical protein [Candidatus Aquilonibacter sp.]